MIRRHTALALLVCTLLSSCDKPGDMRGAAEEWSLGQADWVLLNARIYTSDATSPWAEAVAIKGDRFVYVGDDSGAARFLADGVRVTDLAGRLVLPGLIDGHTHPGYIGVEHYDASLPETSHEDLLAAVKQAADDNPGDGWLRLCCWPNHLYVEGRNGPHKRDLDAVVSDRPVWIASGAWHSNWLNSKGLEVLGVDANTPDPRPVIATYVRDEDGELTGWIKEGAAWQHFHEQFPIRDPDAHRKEIVAFLDTLSRHGVTTVYDAANLGYADEVYGYLSELDRKGELPLRYEGTYAIFLPSRMATAIAELKRLRREYGGNRLRFNTIKMFMDGINENRSAGMIDAYSDDETYESTTMFSAAELAEFLLQLNDEELDLHIHAIGDLAVRTALDGVEAARADAGENWQTRVTISHLELIDPEDWPRFGELGVSANFTPWWHGDDEPGVVKPALGPERAARTYTAKPLFETGGNVTFSSDDWRLDVLSPFLGMQVGHTRKYPSEWIIEAGNDPAVYRPPVSEMLDLELMVKGYTINGAWPFRLENDIGSIEAGKLADLVVLDDDLFSINAEDIHKIEPAAVVMEGKLIQGSLP